MCEGGRKRKIRPSGLWALRYMHDPKAGDGLIAAYGKDQRQGIERADADDLGAHYKKRPITTVPGGGVRVLTRMGLTTKPLNGNRRGKVKDFLMREWNKNR